MCGVDTLAQASIITCITFVGNLSGYEPNLLHFSASLHAGYDSTCGARYLTPPLMLWSLLLCLYHCCAKLHIFLQFSCCESCAHSQICFVLFATIVASLRYRHQTITTPLLSSERFLTSPTVSLT